MTAEHLAHKLLEEIESLKKENEVLKKKIKDDSWRWEQYIGTSDLKKYSELQSQLSIMREVLDKFIQWSKNVENDSQCKYTRLGARAIQLETKQALKRTEGL